MQSTTVNVTTVDRGLRHLLGLVMILIVLTQPWAPAWFALLATYPVFTGILGWDPLYALTLKLAARGAAPSLVNRPAV